MAEIELGILMNGVTGRMGTNQHLLRSIVAIIEQGGVRGAEGSVVMPRPILAGRNREKLENLAGQVADRIGTRPEVTTDAEAAMRSDACDIVFDASATQLRPRFIELAASAGKPVYCEKPTATNYAEAIRTAEIAERAGIKNGVVQDKLWLAGILKLKKLIDAGFFGDILSVRGEFGYWVFTGHDESQPAQRPSWNYRAEDGGGIMIDMFCHWSYVLQDLFAETCGPVTRLAAWANTDIPERIDEHGAAYKGTADDSAYAMFLLGDRVMAQFNSSWCTRVRRDDLLTIQVDGTKGSAVAGLRDCRVQSLGETPRPVWNPDLPQPIDFYGGWTEVDQNASFDNAFKAQWELFLRHVAFDEPFPWTLRRGTRGVQLAELGMRAWREQAWLEAPQS